MTLPTPSKLNALRGNPSLRHRRPEPEPVTFELLPDPPKLLDEIGQDEWRRVGVELHRLGLLTIVDLAIFEAYCDSYSQWWHARDTLRKMAENDPVSNALMVKGSAGSPVVNPLVKIANIAGRNMLRYAAELGCTPVARARIAVGGFDQAPTKFGGLLAS